MLKKIKRAYNDIIISFITHISGPTGRKIRYWYWKKRFKKCGKNVFIDEGVIIQNPEWISVGDNVWIDRYCVLLAGKPDENKSSKVFYIKENPDYKYERGELVISDNVHIAPFCTIQAHGGVFIGKNVGLASGSKVYSLSHHYRNPSDKLDLFEYRFTPMAPKSEQALISAAVVIKDNCAVGLNCVILPGTILEEGTWLGVSSYISGKTEKSSIYSSDSAKLKKKKFM
ncbi:MAG: hypothetical protein ACUVQP_09935 [Bacteroidales bacterium]